jgi:hypothetical protein
MPKENFWVMVEDGDGQMLHSEEVGVHTKHLMDLKSGERNPVEISFFLPFKGKD